MLRDENIANQAMINEKLPILQAFHANIQKLNYAPKKEDIDKFFILHNQYKAQIEVLRQRDLLTYQEAERITSAFHQIYNLSFTKHNLKTSEFFQVDQVKLDNKVWQEHTEACLINNASDVFCLQSKMGLSSVFGALFNLSMIIGDGKAGKYTSEQIRPVVTALIKFLVDIIIQIEQQNDPEQLKSLRELRHGVMCYFELACKKGFVSGEDAYRIACAIEFSAQSQLGIKQKKDEKWNQEQIVQWKNYAIKVGDRSAIRDVLSENNEFILKVWKQFLKDIAPRKYSLFQEDQDRNAAIDLQKQLIDLAEGDVSMASSKRMVHVIAAFYLEQMARKGPKDNFVSRLSAVFIDILVKLSQWDEKIKAVLLEEGENAFGLIHKYKWDPKGDQLISVLKICPIALNNTLTSLHMNDPEVSRTEDLGPEYVGPGYGSGHGL